MNWLHRRLPTGLRHFLRAEYGNLLLAFTRARLASRIVYQSEFSRTWWERVHGRTAVPCSVVYNGVDLDQYNPNGPHDRPADRCRLLLVEGSLMGGYELGLDAAVQLGQGLAERLNVSQPREGRKKVELVVVGRVATDVQQRWSQRAGDVSLHWAGLVRRGDIPRIDRSAHLLYSTDINAACPNSVIEALACGLPVVAFDTGALPELVPPQAGRVVPYGGDPWRLDPPDLSGLVEAAAEVLEGGEAFRSAARSRAEAAFGLDAMVDGYLEAILGQ
jgi:glycosyltransferase involved in cell wall biosynthesis